MIGTSKMPLFNLNLIRFKFANKNIPNFLWQGFVRLSYRYGNIYREVVKTPHVNDFCGLIKVMRTDKILLQSLQDATNQIAPGSLHEYPNTVRIKTQRFWHWHLTGRMWLFGICMFKRPSFLQYAPPDNTNMSLKRSLARSSSDPLQFNFTVNQIRAILTENELQTDFLYAKLSVE